MNHESCYRDNWLDVDPLRLDAFEAMSRWRPEMAPMLAPAAIEKGHVVVDYACGPGMLSLELARVDRAICKNVLEYVDDPVESLRDFRRVLRAGGMVHAIDTDWGMLAAEPIESGRLPETVISRFVSDVKTAVEAGTYLLVLPQFLVTGAA